jgi:TonB family protein
MREMGGILRAHTLHMSLPEGPMIQPVKKAAAILLMTMVFALAGPAYADDQPRKIKSQVQPTIPEMARQIRLNGAVRLEVEIGADGSVKSTKALGGHPLLIESAEQAIRKWRYEPGPATKTVVEFNFHQD